MPERSEAEQHSEVIVSRRVETGVEWWRNAVFYQIYPRSFADADGDGEGDLPGVTSRLDYLKLLGIDAIWLSPFYTSPMADGGYDVANPCDVDPVFGTLDDFDSMLAAAHARDIRITVDIVPNHFSDQHPWFQAALACAAGSPERERFIFREGKGEHGELPPNNWPSVFGGPAWHRITEADGTPGQWYLHIFAPEQPDLNWLNPEIPDEFERVMRFWLDRGVDGFRIDVAHSMAKPDGLPDMDLSVLTVLEGMPTGDDPRWDHDSVHDIHRRFRATLDTYAGDRMAVGEAWVPDSDRLALYVRADELNLTFNFELLEAKWGVESFTTAIVDSLKALAAVGAPCTWVLSNHDVDRHTTRYGGGEIGRARGRAAALLQLSLPGSVYIYNGDELGLENVDLPDDVLQDPTWRRSGFTERGRDGERVPLPWEGEAPPFGFSPESTSWLPMPTSWADVTVEKQLESSASTLSLYREALELRATTPELLGHDFAWISAPEGCLAFRRGEAFVVAVNFSELDATLPPGEVQLASAPLPGGGVLPPNSAVWLTENRFN